MLDLSRREFIQKSLSAAAGLLSASPISSILGCASTCPKRIKPEIRHGRVLADLHVHPLIEDWIRRSPIVFDLRAKIPGIEDVLTELLNETGVTWQTSHDAGVDMMCVAHFNLFDEWLTMPTDPNPEAPRNTLRMMDLLEQELKGPAVEFGKLTRNYLELERMLAIPKTDPDYRIAVVHALEGGHAFGGTVDSLNEFARRGVAMIAITHFFNKGIATSANSYPYFPDSSSAHAHQGLSEFGREVVKRMEDLGIIVDVAHATSTAVKDVLNVAQRPFLSSHTPVRTLGDHPHSMHDEHIQQIAEKGGLIGVILMPYWLSNYANLAEAEKYGSLEDVVRSIRYIYKICGHNHDHIGIGTDFAGGIPALKDMTCHGEINRLRQLLLREFDKDEQIVEDIMANNVIEFFKNNWRSGLPNHEG